MDLYNKTDWARETGTLPLHLRGNLDEDRYILLDGGYYDFCLDLTGTDRDPLSFRSEAWSSNTKNFIQIQQNNIFVHNWLTEDCDSLPLEIVKKKFSQFISILNSSSYKTSEDIMPFVLSLFRQMRNQTREAKEPLYALNLLYRLLISVDKDDITNDVCDKWGIMSNIPTPVGFAELVDKIKKGVRGLTPNLDLILRHGSGMLFQEAHREVEGFDYQYNLFGEMNDVIHFKNILPYSSIHYTPQYLARSIVEKTIDSLDLEKKSLKILDPSCGSGSFLVEVLKQLNEKKYAGHVYVEGMDVSDSAVSTTNFLLTYEKRTQWQCDRLTFTVRKVNDSLLENWDQDYDLIVMNPPFLSMELLKLQESKDAVNDTLRDLNMHRRPNQAAAFLYKAIQSLSDSGLLGVVLPSSILLLEQYNSLRSRIREMGELQVVARLGNFVFEDVLTDASFVIFKRGDQRLINPQTIWCKNEDGVAYKALKEWRKLRCTGQSEAVNNSYSIYIPLRFPIVHQTWKTVPYKDYDFISKVISWRDCGMLSALGEIFEVRQGALKGNQSAFEISSEQYKQLSDEAKVLFKPLASSKTIGDGVISDDYYIWYPYNTNGLIIKNEGEIPQDSIVKGAVTVHKDSLRKRKGINEWWGLTRPRNWQYVLTPCIVSKRFGNSRSFAFNDQSM